MIRNAIPMTSPADDRRRHEKTTSGESNQQRTIQVTGTKSHVHHQVILPPQNREQDGYNAEDRKGQREGTIEAVKVFRRHFLWLTCLLGSSKGEARAYAHTCGSEDLWDKERIGDQHQKDKGLSGEGEEGRSTSKASTERNKD